MLQKKDLHIHATAYNMTPTISHNVANVVEQCQRNGLDYAGILEHLNFNHKHPLHCIESLITEFRQLNLPSSFFVGVEADINHDGSDSCGAELRRQLGLDYIIGSVHLGPKHFTKVEAYIDEELRRITNTLQHNPNIDIIGHPWVQGIRWERNGSIAHWDFDMVPEAYLEQIIDLAITNNKAIEVNNLPEIFIQESYQLFLKKLLASEVKITVGSDAHRIEKIKESNVRTQILEQLGFIDERIWGPFLQ
jgi:histidinol phosphatase-like PHP family hydrolase